MCGLEGRGDERANKTTARTGSEKVEIDRKREKETEGRGKGRENIKGKVKQK